MRHQAFNDPADVDHFINVFLLANGASRPLPAVTAVVVIHGNEDCPEEIHLYAVDDYRCVPTEYVLTESGDYVYARGPMPVED